MMRLLWVITHCDLYCCICPDTFDLFGRIARYSCNGPVITFVNIEAVNIEVVVLKW